MTIRSLMISAAAVALALNFYTRTLFMLAFAGMIGMAACIAAAVILASPAYLLGRLIHRSKNKV
jgi:hypothetical protein